MNDKVMAGMKVRRTKTETAVVNVPIDINEFVEWSGGLAPEEAPYAMVAEFIEADADFPGNVQALGLSVEWGVSDIEVELPRD